MKIILTKAYGATVSGAFEVNNYVKLTKSNGSYRHCESAWALQRPAR